MDTDLLLTAAAVTATIVACTAAGNKNTLCRQSVLSIEQLAVTITAYLATGKTTCALK